MNRLHALVTVVAGIAMSTAGLVWLFGPFGLIGVGLPLTVGGLLVDHERK